MGVLRSKLMLLWVVFLTLSFTRCHGTDSATNVESKKSSQERVLFERYKINPDEIIWGHRYPFVLHGTDESHFGKLDLERVIEIKDVADVITVGSGPAGLEASLMASEQGKRVFLLEREGHFGGLAAGSLRSGVHFGRGSAYFADVEGLTQKLYEHLGVGDYEHRYLIPSPIDSYIWNGKMYEGLWESPQALKELPASFSLFKFMMKRLNRSGYIGNVPLEQNEKALKYDDKTMLDWVQSLPNEIRKISKRNKRAAGIVERFDRDILLGKIDARDPMRGVIGLLELYGRSALGEHPDLVSAAAFLNFYISEIGERFTSNSGAGTISSHLIDRIRQKSDLVRMLASADIRKIIPKDDGVEVYFVKDGNTYKAKSKYLVFAAPLRAATELIQDFDKIAPRQSEIIKKIEHRHYLVINTHVQGHPWKETYDLWIRDDNSYSQAEPTDIIDGRWMDFKGGKGPRTDDRGVLTIYQPLPKEAVGAGLKTDDVLRIASQSIEKMKALLNPVIQKQGGGPLQIYAAEINRWPYSIHLVKPGHLHNTKSLREPIGGRIFLANNNVGVPAVEEGIYSGNYAAQKILEREGVITEFHPDSSLRQRPNCGNYLNLVAGALP